MRRGALTRGILLGCALLAIGGCKLKVYVPTGAGHVESKSGAFYCSLLSVCNIEINNTAFEETFRAVPKEGFVFAGWKDRPRGLYANSIEDAYITTAVASPSQALLDLLASEEVYYLEPRFIEMGTFAWESRGADLLGTPSQPVDRVELSADGGVYAVIDKRAPGISASVHEWTGSRWRQRGEAIGRADPGPAVDIALSRDGSVLAYASETPDGANEVSVFRWNGSLWQPLGAAIKGEHPGDASGVLALSGDGTRLAIGAPGNKDGGAAAGHTRVFSWDGNDWRQLGGDIDGGPGSMAGSAVDLSANGGVLAVGSPANADRAQDRPGEVTLYRWDGSAWAPWGESLLGHSPRDGFGRYLSLSGSGRHLAVGSESTYATVFMWDGSRWAGRGSTLHSDMSYIERVEVDISDSGGILAVSEPGYGVTGFYAGEGRVRVLIWDGSKWVRLGDPVFGDSSCPDRSGCPEGMARGARLSADGSILAVVDSGTGAERQRGGRVRVFSGEG
jgi:hypothetical protein